MTSKTNPTSTVTTWRIQILKPSRDGWTTWGVAPSLEDGERRIAGLRARWKRDKFRLVEITTTTTERVLEV